MNKKGINLKKTTQHWLVSIILAMILIWITSKITTISYMTNDDFGVILDVGGFLQTQETGYSIFLHPWLYYFINSLYNLDLGINWYPILQVFCLTIAIVIIFFCVFQNYKSETGVMWKPIFINIMLYVLLMMIQVYALSFTTVPAIMGSAAIALLYTDTCSNKYNIISCITQMFLLLVAYWWRVESGYVTLFFYGISVIILGFRKRKTLRNKVIVKKVIPNVVIYGVLLLGIVASTVMGNIVREKSQYKDFQNYQDARYKYTDYPHETYNENEKRYQKEGVSEELYDLMENWCLWII